MMGAIDNLKVALLVMLFFSVAMTLLAHALPDDSLKYISDYSGGSRNLDTMYNDVEDSLNVQTNIPIIEVGALIFYSGNFIVDLILNFIFAIPEMLGLLIHGIMIILNVDSYLFMVVEAFASIAIFIFYVVSIIEMLANLRSGTGRIA